MNKKVTMEERALSIDLFFYSEFPLLLEEEMKKISDQYDSIVFTQEAEDAYDTILSEVLPEQYYNALKENRYDDDFYDYLLTLSREQFEEYEQLVSYLKCHLKQELFKLTEDFKDED